MTKPAAPHGHIDSIIFLPSKSEISSLQPLSVMVQPGLCWIWLETPKTGFVMTQLNSYCAIISEAQSQEILIRLESNHPV